MTDEFIAAFTQLMSDKAQIMDGVTTQLGNAKDATTVARILLRAAETLQHFNESAERPLASQYPDYIEAPPVSAGPVMHKHKRSIGAFISALQIAKYDSVYAKDNKVVSAVAYFESVTARIPARG